jgi:hypothetical protein
MHPIRSLSIGTYLRTREALIRLAAWLREPAVERDVEAYRVKAHDRTLDALEGLSPGARAAAEAGIALAKREPKRARVEWHDLGDDDVYSYPKFKR